MDLKLNIYEKKKIIKTYTCDTYDLMFGTVEDFLKLINADDLKTGTDAEILVIIGKALPTGMETVKSLFKDVFDGVTDEELKNTKVKEIIQLLVAIIKYSVEEIGLGSNGKN